jgi:hypothetical protein
MNTVIETTFARLPPARLSTASICDQAAASALEHRVDLRENLLHLRFEVVRDVVAGVVARRRLAGDPHDLAAFGDHAGREGARELERCLLHVLGHAFLRYW